MNRMKRDNAPYTGEPRKAADGGSLTQKQPVDNGSLMVRKMIESYERGLM